SPTPAAGFMAAAAKTAGFAALLRIFFVAFGTLRLDWQPMVWALAVLSLVVGSVLAVVQTDVKRMLAYSSISHAGYVLIGLQAATDQGIAASLFYLLAYTFMILGSFAVVTMVGRTGDGHHALDDYRGLSRNRPGLALALTVFLLAQAGVPFTSGFLAKFGVIAAAVQSRSYAIAVIAMVAAVIATFFYLRVIVVMYMSGDQPAGPAVHAVDSLPTDAALPADASADETPADVSSDDLSPVVVAAATTGTATTAGTTAGTTTAAATATAPTTTATTPTTAPATVGAAEDRSRLPIPVGAGIAVALCLAFTIGAGLLPEPFLDLARHAVLLKP
ncbi:MAG: NADH-quinone oxidoreductase subunit, partial [Actinomycetota bacterium]|nr:NADH-quinone oxidoreductase subunit [Actinomycetota bacterium]